MSGSAYHNEALRKARVLERKHEALNRLGMPEKRSDDYGINYNGGSRSVVGGTPLNPSRAGLSCSPLPMDMPSSKVVSPGGVPRDNVLTPMRTPSPAALNGTVPSPAPEINVIPGSANGRLSIDKLVPDDNDDQALFDLSSY